MGQSFQDFKLSSEIEKAIDSLGYKRPTQVQQAVIPLVLQGNCLVVRSQTGSGKTASYAIPICEKINWLDNKPQALVLTPTRELAVQVSGEFTDIGRLKRVKAVAIFGRQPFAVQKTELKQKTHVVVGTPGRILDHLERGTINLSQIKYLVVDEADEMLSMGFIDAVETIIKQLPSNIVTMLFSATVPDEVKKLADKFMDNPMHIEVNASEAAAVLIEHVRYDIKEEEKIELLKKLTVVENPDSCIIFCKTKDRVDLLHQTLASLKYPCNKIHGGMEQDERLRIMNDFKRGKFRYLIATDVAARGIDIEHISLVINYDVPLKKENYVHRTGRTGRAGLSGKAVIFVTPKEERYLEDISELLQQDIPIVNSPTEEEVRNAKEAFNLKLREQPEMKRPKNEKLNKGITTLCFNGGKKKKLRATNFVGIISNIEGLTVQDIGIITITDRFTYVDILNQKGDKVLEVMKNTKICGKQLKVSKVKD